jgi:hypothetical protein
MKPFHFFRMSVLPTWPPAGRSALDRWSFSAAEILDPKKEHFYTPGMIDSHGRFSGSAAGSAAWACAWGDLQRMRAQPESGAWIQATACGIATRCGIESGDFVPGWFAAPDAHEGHSNVPNRACSGDTRGGRRREILKQITQQQARKNPGTFGPNIVVDGSVIDVAPAESESAKAKDAAWIPPVKMLL